MKWRRKKTERYAELFSRFENAVDQRLHKWSDLLQLKSDQLSYRQKYILFMIFCIGVSVVCATIILNVFK
jgi:hypothetical protein